LNREKALSFCFYAIPDAKPLRTFAGIALGEFSPAVKTISGALGGAVLYCAAVS
jgi:serine-type D-Ala-D-Ala carboxypeptidase (penicillin-binding protein 5/6)